MMISPKKKRRFFFNIAFYIIGAAVFVFSCMFKVKIFVVQSERIGGYLLSLEAFLRGRSLGTVSSRQKYLFFSGECIANKFLFNKYKELVKVTSNNFLYKLAGEIQAKYPSRFYSNQKRNMAYFEFNNTTPLLSFSKHEKIKGTFLLQEMGVDLNRDKMVCLFSRDNAYLKKTFPNKDWSYHEYRNVDIDKFEKAVNFLLSQNYFIIRVGNIVEKKISIKHEKVIDYPFTKYCSDFMDIFLIANCEFVLGTDSGCVDIAKAFNVPSLIVSYPRLAAAPHGCRSLYTPAKLRCINSNRILTFQEVLKLKLDDISSSEVLQELGLSLVVNSREEILDATKEMYEKIICGVGWSKEEEELQDKFFDEFRSKTAYSMIKTRIASSFLARNKELCFKQEPQ